MRNFFWGFNGVSFEISKVYVRMYNFRPKEFEQYNYLINYAMKKIKIKSHSNLRPFKWKWKCYISFGVSTGFRLKLQTCMYERIIFGRMNLNDSIISLSTLRKKIKIYSHSNFRPFKNMKVRNFIWGLNKVSFEISTEYERMCNFRPKDLKRYNFFILYAMKKIKIKSQSNLRPFK
jgi:hypothetical protein